MILRPFQRQFLRGALSPGVDTAALSIPRGNGKSWLAAFVLTNALRQRSGHEFLLCAASIEQARIVHRFVRQNLGDEDWRYLDSATRMGISDPRTNTRLRVLSSAGKRAMGIVGCPLLVADEPGSWEVAGGQLMHDAIQTAQGKPGSKMRVVYIGTLAPALSGWWHDMIADGTRRSTYVQCLQGERETWDSWRTIRRANPLVEVDGGFRKKLLEERDDARRDSRLKARFLSYRLNLPSADESEVLLTVDDWKRVAARPVEIRHGKPVVGMDLGANRAWSAAVALWRNGRVEAVAVAPGIPSVEEQEKRDRVPAGTYARLVQDGTLMLASGLRVPPAGLLVDAIRQRFGQPDHIVCDRFRLDDLRDTSPPCQVVPRVTRWSEAAADIRALRRMAQDGPLSVETSSRSMLAASLAAARVKNDESGNVRMVKRGTNNEARDDVAAALALAAGAVERMPELSTPKLLAIV